jgi:hypothetical protein
MSILDPLLSRVCRTHHWIRKGAHPSHMNEPLTDEAVEQHLNGGYPRGVCPIAPGESVTRCAVLDFDSHKGETPWTDMVRIASAVTSASREHGLKPVAFRSTGGSGIHLIYLWKEPQDAYSVRTQLAGVLASCGLSNGVGGVSAGEVEIFPKQDNVPADGFGSMFILPGNGKSEYLGELE